MTTTDPLEGCYQKANDAQGKRGGLYSLGWYLAYTDGQEHATLDGTFTARDLEAIALYMREHQR